MKNKRLYKYFLISLMEIIFAVILTNAILFFMAKMGKIIYEYSYYVLENRMLERILERIIVIYRRQVSIDIISSNNLLPSLYISTMVKGIIFAICYISIIYKKSKGLVDVIKDTELMATGDLERIIEVNTKGDIKKLADNINNISKQFKEKTIAERNAQKTKNDLVTNVSHDLRTPLTSIIGYLELIENDKYKDEVALRYYINIAYQKSKSLNILINDLFELTKMQNNTSNLNKVDINLIELLGQVVASFEYQVNSANMALRIKFTNDKVMINADGEKLVRAFENLVSNAIKYGKDGYYIDIDTKIEDEIVVIKFKNYGEGIPLIHLPYIFDRFYRAETSRNSEIGGSGLGLAITKNIIELHNGKIEAYSDDSLTVFEVRLPIIQKVSS